jgi:hypothetical protein
MPGPADRTFAVLGLHSRLVPTVGVEPFKAKEFPASTNGSGDLRCVTTRDR